ncbi:MAG: PAS domain-containing protein [Ghiorsea sp.]
MTAHQYIAAGNAKLLSTANSIGSSAIVLGILYWPFEAAVHTFIFNAGSFYANCFQTEIHETWMRVLVSFTFILLGFVTKSAFNQQNKLIQQLERQEIRSRNILKSARDAYISINAESIITDWNPKAEEIFGWPRSLVIGKSLTETIIPERFKEMHTRGMKRYIETSSGPRLYKPITMPASTKQGQEITIEMEIVPLSDGHIQEFYTFIKQVKVD